MRARKEGGSGANSTGRLGEDFMKYIPLTEKNMLILIIYQVEMDLKYHADLQQMR